MSLMTTGEDNEADEEDDDNVNMYEANENLDDDDDDIDMIRYAAKSNLEKLRVDLEDENLRLRFLKEKHLNDVHFQCVWSMCLLLAPQSSTRRDFHPIQPTHC